MGNSFELFGTNSKNLSLISKQETKRLLEEGTKEALNKVFEGNLGLVSHVVNKDFYKVENKEDLYQVGSVGLWKSILNFDLSMNTEFSTYAVPLIKGEIMRSIRDNDSMRISRGIKDLASKIFVIKEEYSKNHNGNEISPEELSDILMVPVNKIEDAINAKRDLLSIDEPAYSSDKAEDIYFKDVIKDNNQMIDQEILYKSYLDVLNNMIDNLSERDQGIVKYLYGIGVDKKSQTDIANIFNISQAQVSRVGAKFKKAFKDEIGIKEYDNLRVEAKKVAIKDDKDTQNQTIYEILSRFNNKDIDTIIDELPLEQQEMLLVCYPKSFKEKKIRLNSVYKSKAKQILNQVIYKLALLEVSKPMTTLNYDSNIISRRKENVIVEKEKLSSVALNNNLNDKSIYITEKLMELLPNVSKEELCYALEKLSPRQKELLTLSYGIYDNIPLSNSDIVLKLGLTEKNVCQHLYNARKKIRELLPQENKKEESIQISNDLPNEILKNDNYDEIYNIQNIINQIKNGKFGYDNKIYKCGRTKILVEVTLGDCLISSVDSNKGLIRDSLALRKRCYVYRLKSYDEKGKLINQNIIIREKNIKKYYNMLMKDNNNNYIFSNVKNNEVICYEINNEEKITKDIIKSENTKEKTKISLNQYIQQLYKKALFDLKEKNLYEAETKFAKILSIANDDDVCFNANVNLAEIYKKKNKPLLAEKYYKQALSIRKDYLTFVKLGIVLYKQGKYNKALSCFEECDKICYWKANHLVEKAKTFYLMGNIQESIAQLDDCILNNENYYQAHWEKAKILYEQGMYEEALVEIEKCNKLKPNENNHMIIKGKINYINGKENEAFKIFDDCIMNDNKRNVMYSIIEIGYFFQERNEKELCYKYYNQTPMFPKWINLTEQEISEHFEKHKFTSTSEKMHSVFNVDLKLSDLQNIVNNMSKTGLKQLYDVYQVYWPNIGYMQVDEENVTLENYLTIFTLPFSKKVMMAYPDSKFDGRIISEPAVIEDLIHDTGLKVPFEKQNNQEENDCSILKNEKHTNILGLKDTFENKQKVNEKTIEIMNIMNSVSLEVQNEIKNSSTESSEDEYLDVEFKSEECLDDKTNNTKDSGTNVTDKLENEEAHNNNNLNERNMFEQPQQKISDIDDNKDNQLDYLKLYEIFQDSLSDNIIKELNQKEFIIVTLKLNYGPHSNKEIADFLNIEQKQVDAAINNYFVKLKQQALSIVNSAFDKFIDDSSAVDNIAFKYKK